MRALLLFLVILILIIINQSYECSVSATNCTSCDDLNTKRTLSTNACACTLGFFDNYINRYWVKINKILGHNNF